MRMTIQEMATSFTTHIRWSNSALSLPSQPPYTGPVPLFARATCDSHALRTSSRYCRSSRPPKIVGVILLQLCCTVIFRHRLLRIGLMICLYGGRELHSESGTDIVAEEVRYVVCDEEMRLSNGTGLPTLPPGCPIPTFPPTLSTVPSCSTNGSFCCPSAHQSSSCFSYHNIFRRPLPVVIAAPYRPDSEGSKSSLGIVSLDGGLHDHRYLLHPFCMLRPPWTLRLGEQDVS